VKHLAALQINVVEAGKELMHGVKAIEADGKQLVVLWTMNSFQDREGETFATKSIEDYVARRDKSGIQDRLWFWHVKGTDFGTIVWQDVVGKFLVEVAELDQTEYGQKMFHALQHPENYPELLPEGWGTSHGYLYPANYKQNSVYQYFEKFESTVLPFHRASNSFGGVKEVLSMKGLTAEKRAALATLVGEQRAKEILDQPASATDLLERLGISSKELDGEAEDVPATDQPETEATEAAASEPETEAEAEEEAKSDVMELELTDELVKEIAAQVDIKTAAKEYVDTLRDGIVKDVVDAVSKSLAPAIQQAISQQVVGAKESVVQQALAGKLRLRPYSPTQAKDNILSDAGAKELNADADKELTGGAAVVHAIAAGMLNGSIG